jgi:hypothetical protein
MLCYQGTFPDFAPVPVQFQDQFQVAPQARTVRSPHWLCNPVKKTRDDVVTPVVDQRQHLKAYKLAPSSNLDEVTVQFSNQFLTSNVDVEKRAVSILVPTRKKPHDAPVGLDHFQCHRIVGGGPAVDAKVELEDQFGTRRTEVGKPKLVCNPTLKIHNAQPFPPVNPTAHLVCYKIKPRDLAPPIDVKTINQFGKERVRAKTAVRLCVPSTKTLS